MFNHSFDGEHAAPFILTNQDMMEWMSRILVREMVSAIEDFGLEVGQIWLNFVPSQNHKSTQHLPHGPADDPSKTINFMVTVDISRSPQEMARVFHVF
jgi:hypothetical protein